MSTTIPSASDVNVQATGESWRFSQGALVRGKEIEDDRGRETGRYPEEKTRLIGALRRVGIYDNPNSKYGKRYKLEADIETTEGMVHVGVNLLKPSGEMKPGISAVGFAWCLLQFAKDEVMMIETKLGEAVQLEDGTKGGKPTYVNAFRVDGKNASPIYRPRRDPSAPRQTILEQWAELEVQLREHPAYAEREVRNDDDESPGAPAVAGPGYTAMVELIADQDKKRPIPWPTLETAPAVWLEVFQTLTKEAAPRPSLDSWSDEHYAEFAKAIAKVKWTTENPMPKAVKAWADSAANFDPFPDDAPDI